MCNKRGPSYGREKGRHTRRVQSLKRYAPCVISHSVTSKDLDLSDLEVYGFHALSYKFSPPILPISDIIECL